jgi:hypothetical protein
MLSATTRFLRKLSLRRKTPRPDRASPGPGLISAPVPLLSGSLAINAGSSTLAVGPDHQPLGCDQRGVPFAPVMGGTVDIGAFESRGFTPAVVSGDGQTAPVMPMEYAWHVSLLALGLIFGMLVLLELGRRIGIRRRAQDAEGVSASRPSASGSFLRSSIRGITVNAVHPTTETELEPVPGHYKDMLGLPF